METYSLSGKAYYYRGVDMVPGSRRLTNAEKTIVVHHAENSRKTPKQEKTKNRKEPNFFSGLLLGISAAFFVIAFAVTSYMLIHGVRFSIDEEELALAVREKTRVEATRELPVLLGQLQEEFPRMVQEMVPDLISFGFGQSRIDLPPSAIAAIRVEIANLTKEGLNEQLKEIDVEQYADRLADIAYDLVKTTLESEVSGRTFHLRANRWMSIPVTVMAK